MFFSFVSTKFYSTLFFQNCQNPPLFIPVHLVRFQFGDTPKLTHVIDSWVPHSLQSAIQFTILFHFHNSRWSLFARETFANSQRDQYIFAFPHVRTAKLHIYINDICIRLASYLIRFYLNSTMQNSKE